MQYTNMRGFDMTGYLIIGAVFLYLLAGFLLGRRLFSGTGQTDASKTPPLAIGLTAVLFHAIALQQAIFTPLGMNLAFFNVLSLVTWVIALLVLLSAIPKPVENLGVVILPLVALAALLQLIFHTEPTLVNSASVELDLHILLSVLSYSLLSIAAVQALALAAQDHQLRNRHPGGFVRALPPLETMESLLFQMIAVGYVLLSLSLITGAAFLEDIFAQHLVHKTVLSIMAWLLFAILLWGRWQFGWRGRTAIRWTLGGFALLALAYFGSKMVLELILNS